MYTRAFTFRLAGLAVLLAGSSHAVSAVPTITATGTFAAAPAYQAGTPHFINPSALNGRSFELTFGFPAVGFPASAVHDAMSAIPGLPGEFIHSWYPGDIQYTLKVDGSVLLSGVSPSAWTWLEAFDDLTPTAAILASLQPGDVISPLIVAGGTYDNVLIDSSSIHLGCLNAGVPGPCGIGSVYEGATLHFDYTWDTAVKNAFTLTGVTPANPLVMTNAFFTGGLGIAGLSVWHWDGVTGSDLLVHGGTVSVAAVPEAETWAMLLAGLGLVGWMTARRRRDTGRPVLPSDRS